MIDTHKNSIYIRDENIAIVLTKAEVDLWAKALRMVARSMPQTITGRDCASQHAKLAMVTRTNTKENEALQRDIPKSVREMKMEKRSEKDLYASQSTAKST